MMMVPSKKTSNGYGYTCGFVEEPPELFKCGVCRLVLRDPQITECCRKNACRPCIERAASSAGSCPIPGCNNARVKGFGDRTLKYEILERRVYCYYKDEGCQWVDKLEHLEKHLKDCQFVEVECQYYCGVNIQRKNIKAHEVMCQRLPLNCHQCGNIYERQHLSHHLESCPFTTVKCPFKVSGCTIEVLNKDLQRHFNEALSDHYSLVENQSQDVQVQVKETGSTLLVQNEKLSKRNAEVAALNNKVMAAHVEVTELQKALEEAKLEFEELKRKHTKMKAELQSQFSQRDTTSKSLKQDLDKLMVESKMKCHGPALPRPNPRDVVSRPLNCPPTTEEYTPVIAFMINNFHQERQNDALLCLPPFFSHHGGYKMCLLVYCNGYGEAKNKSLSIHVCVLKGPYDEYLQWPLNCKLMVEIKNICDSRVYKKCLQVKSLPRVMGSNQIYHKSTLYNVTELPSLKLLIDGCLTIDISKVSL